MARRQGPSGGLMALRAALGAVAGGLEGYSKSQELERRRKVEEQAAQLAQFNALRAAEFRMAPVRTQADPAAAGVTALDTPKPAPSFDTTQQSALGKALSAGMGVGTTPASPLTSPVALALDTSKMRQFERGAKMQAANPVDRITVGGMELGVRAPETPEEKKAKEDAQFEAAIANLPPETQRLARMSRVLPSNVLQAIATPKQEGMTEYQKKTLALRERELGMRGNERTKEDKPRFGEMSSLRKEFNTESRPYKTINDALLNIEKLGTKTNPTPQDLQALVYQFVKVQDPTSVVRESEYANAANASALADKLGNIANSVINGQKLSPKQRADMVQTARLLREEAMNQYRSLADSYESLAKSYGMEPKTIVPNRIDSNFKPQAAEPAISAVDALKNRRGGK